MIENFARKAEIEKVKLGLIGAITTVNLKQEAEPLKEQKEYEVTARKFLNYLADTESLIHKIYPHLLEEHGEIIEKARETFPEPESGEYLQKLLDAFH